ncbi:MAG: Fructose-bisphosphate aldolase [Parcubacteria group bacterium GW2011_GWC2_39_14]|nr:MAG: Fructose-bisphosphate aldolase [Parcubacteria group bacterium GW2011_GWC2_39_14]KKR55561.1 MAG: Fructose-bisphosphate aldolase [Parcubacteria group bacterium GW2011_GWA2_40_23]
MLVHIKKIITAAEKGKYAVGAFNVNNLEIVQAVVNAAEKMKAPVIVQVTEGAIKYAGLKEITALVKSYATETKIPVALHLDHGHDFKIIKKCITAGFSSVMIDASGLPYKKNVELTKKVVAYAHARKVWVQAELGTLEGAEDWIKVGKGEGYFTDPKEAKRFVKETNINSFAPSVGNYHGVAKIVEKKVLKLDLKRLAEIGKIVPVPLVLHGASGFPEGQIKAAIKAGIRVINIDSELRLSFARAERTFFEININEYDPRKILEPAIIAMQKVVIKKITLFGSRNKAK